MKKIQSKTTRKNAATLIGVCAVYIVLLVLDGGGFLSRSLSGQLVPISAYIIMALSLNLTVGILGELSLGHAGFMSIGAFSGVVAAAVLGPYIVSPLLLMLVCVAIGGILAGIMGFLIGIPVLRLRGDYLAIVTLAFGEIIRTIFNCLYVELVDGAPHFSMFGDGVDTINGNFVIAGAQGASISNRLSTLGFGFALVLFTLVIIMNLVHSKEGRAIKAIRDNPIAAESVGLNLTVYKMKAFVISAFLAGIAGVLFALNYTKIEAKQFDFNKSISVLVMVVLGGMGNLRGCIIAAVALKLLELFLLDFGDLWMLIYALVLILVMILNANARFKESKRTLGKRVKALLRRKEVAK